MTTETNGEDIAEEVPVASTSKPATNVSETNSQKSILDGNGCEDQLLQATPVRMLRPLKMAIRILDEVDDGLILEPIDMSRRRRRSGSRRRSRSRTRSRSRRRRSRRR